VDVQVAEQDGPPLVYYSRRFTQITGHSDLTTPMTGRP
jgi:hypothetical protein